MNKNGVERVIKWWAWIIIPISIPIFIITVDSVLLNHTYRNKIINWMNKVEPLKYEVIFHMKNGENKIYQTDSFNQLSKLLSDYKTIYYNHHDSWTKFGYLNDTAVCKVYWCRTFMFKRNITFGICWNEVDWIELPLNTPSVIEKKY